MAEFEKDLALKTNVLLQTYSTKCSLVLPEFQVVGYHLGDALVHSGLAIVPLVFGSLCS